MKVSINIKKIDGPFGGGMVFANDLETELTKNGVKVVRTLIDQDIDIILHVNPFPFLMKSAAFSFLEAYIYKLKHPKTIIVQGIHECDERKGTHYMNRLLVRACTYCDFIVYVSSWLEPLLKKNGLDVSKPSKVILHGSSKKTFNMNGKIFWNHVAPLKIVTHHWGAHYLKGHDFYQKLDTFLSNEKCGNKFAFTFIGNYPKNLLYKNSKLVAPISGQQLAEELKKHDVYLTASRNEPAGLHHIEGALCGLPVLYINSGGLKEYCGEYGLEFNQNNFEDKLQEMYDEYESFLEKVKLCNWTSENMGQNYYKLFAKLLKERYKYTSSRKCGFFKIVCYKIYNLLFDIKWRLIQKITRDANKQ